MNDSWLFCVADTPALIDAVTARFAQGPFVPAEDPGKALRRIEIMDGVVHELGANLEHAFLAWDLANRTAEPVILQLDGLEHGLEYAPGSEPLAIARDVPRRPLPDWRPAAELAFDLDLARQRHSSFERDLDTLVRSLFPIQNRARTARLDLKGHKVYGPNERYQPGMWTYENSVHVELQLALFAWDAEGNERSLVETRKETLVLCRYNVVTPTGGMIHRGDERILPIDEYAAEYDRSLRAFARGIRRDMDERTSWTGVTPQTLIDR